MAVELEQGNTDDWHLERPQDITVLNYAQKYDQVEFSLCESHISKSLS